MPMTRRDRLMSIFRGTAPDRSAVKLWGAAPGQACRHPAFEPVRDLAAAKTDLFVNAGSPFNIYCGTHAGDVFKTYERPTESEEWIEQVTAIHTPEGNLEQSRLRHTGNRPGYHKTYACKEPGDIAKLLSLPYTPCAFSGQAYRDQERAVGDDGIVMFGLDHAMYALQRMMGSESFALWSIETPELLEEAIALFAERLLGHVSAALEAGVRGVFGWVGPELCIPPLMSPAAFDRYVVAFDKPLIERIHGGGGHVWVHSHGKMGPVLEQFAGMGIDVLNPIEPPPMGDLTLAQAFARVGNGMGLEGNIETHDFMTAGKDVIEQKIHTALDDGQGRRFILCPSSGYMENVAPGPQEIENWLFYVEEGVRYAEQLSA